MEKIRTLLKVNAGIVFLFLFLWANPMNICARGINGSYPSEKLAKRISRIASDTKKTIAFDMNSLEAYSVSSLNFKDKNVDEILDISLKESPFTFTKLENGSYVITAKETEKAATPVKVTATGSISGKVIDEEGQPVIGASVVISGTGIGVTTRADGKFTLPQVPTGSVNLQVSFISYETKHLNGVKVASGNTTPLDVVLKESTLQLDEVVVTALGIKRAEKSLGYATTSINGDDVTNSKTNNWANALSGKVAGLNVTGVGAGAMGSSRITLRGENSLNMNSNQALIVVDGIPISSKIVSTGFSSHLSADNPVDYGSHASDINPEDIESVNVLKGPAATALYGSRAAAGALIITTKKGDKSKGLNITYSFDASIDQINRWPDYQFEYGEGRSQAYYSYGDSEDGPNTSTSAGGGRSWGPKYDGQMYYQYNPNSPGGKPTERTLWQPYKDAYNGYFRQGYNIGHNLSIVNGNDKSSMRVSLNYLKNNWIIENTGWERYNVSLAASHKMSDKLTVSTNVNYVNKTSDNLPTAGYNNQTLMYYLIIGTTTNVNPNWLRNYWESGLENIQQKRPFYQGPDNPYLVMYEALNKLTKNGAFGNVSANYQFTDKLDLAVKGAVDMSYEKRSQQRPFSMTKYPRGMFRTQDVFLFEGNYDFLLSYKERKENWGYGGSLGGNMMKQTYDFNGMYADQLNQPGIYQISNSLDQAVADPQRSEKAINSLYGMAQFSYKDQIFIDVTGRNDWSSTLPKNNNSFFYPSVNTSWILSDIFKMKKIDYLKLRLSWAQVGNDTDPYQTSQYYNSIYGNGLTNPTVLYNADLKPEITTSYELGVEIRFFKSRVMADVAVYNNDSKNQIVATPIDPTSGYSSKMINAGLINSRGLEASLTLKPLVGKFKWETCFTWSTNRSYVRRLAPGVESQILFANRDDVTIEARVGGRMGDIYGKGFERSPDGQIVFSSEGIPSLLDPVAKKWGNVFPDWKAGMVNTLEYKGFKFHFQLDGQKGGKIYSLTNHKNNEFGNTKVTLPGREDGIVGVGVVKLEDGTYVTNTKRVEARPYYEQYYARANAETNIFDASFLKIREVRLEYKLPQSLLRKTVVKNASIAVYGRDLYNFTKFPAFDPEGGNLNNGSLVQGVELGQYPSTRNMGINISCSF